MDFEVIGIHSADTITVIDLQSNELSDVVIPRVQIPKIPIKIQQQQPYSSSQFSNPQRVNVGGAGEEEDSCPSQMMSSSILPNKLCEPFAFEAREVLRKQFLGRPVQLFQVKSNTNTRNNLYHVVRSDGESVASCLAKRGLAKVLPKGVVCYDSSSSSQISASPTTKSSSSTSSTITHQHNPSSPTGTGTGKFLNELDRKLFEAQEEAKRQRLGIWSGENEGRRNFDVQHSVIPFPSSFSSSTSSSSSFSKNYSNTSSSNTNENPIATEMLVASLLHRWVRVSIEKVVNCCSFEGLILSSLQEIKFKIAGLASPMFPPLFRQARLHSMKKMNHRTVDLHIVAFDRNANSFFVNFRDERAERLVAHGMAHIDRRTLQLHKKGFSRSLVLSSYVALRDRKGIYTQSPEGNDFAAAFTLDRREFVARVVEVSTTTNIVVQPLHFATPELAAILFGEDPSNLSSISSSSPTSSSAAAAQENNNNAMMNSREPSMMSVASSSSSSSAFCLGASGSFVFSPTISSSSSSNTKNPSTMKNTSSSSSSNFQINSYAEQLLESAAKKLPEKCTVHIAYLYQQLQQQNQQQQSSSSSNSPFADANWKNQQQQQQQTQNTQNQNRKHQNKTNDAPQQQDSSSSSLTSVLNVSPVSLATRATFRELLLGRLVIVKPITQESGTLNVVGEIFLMRQQPSVAQNILSSIQSSVQPVVSQTPTSAAVVDDDVPSSSSQQQVQQQEQQQQQQQQEIIKTNEFVVGDSPAAKSSGNGNNNNNNNNKNKNPSDIIAVDELANLLIVEDEDENQQQQITATTTTTVEQHQNQPQQQQQQQQQPHHHDPHSHSQQSNEPSPVPVTPADFYSFSPSTRAATQSVTTATITYHNILDLLLHRGFFPIKEALSVRLTGNIHCTLDPPSQLVESLHELLVKKQAIPEKSFSPVIQLIRPKKELNAVKAMMVPISSSSTSFDVNVDTSTSSSTEQQQQQQAKSTSQSNQKKSSSPSPKKQSNVKENKNNSNDSNIPKVPFNMILRGTVERVDLFHPQGMIEVFLVDLKVHVFIQMAFVKIVTMISTSTTSSSSSGNYNNKNDNKSDNNIPKEICEGIECLQNDLLHREICLELVGINEKDCCFEALIGFSPSSFSSISTTSTNSNDNNNNEEAEDLDVIEILLNEQENFLERSKICNKQEEQSEKKNKEEEEQKKSPTKKETPTNKKNPKTMKENQKSTASTTATEKSQQQQQLPQLIKHIEKQLLSEKYEHQLHYRKQFRSFPSLNLALVSLGFAIVTNITKTPSAPISHSLCETYLTAISQQRGIWNQQEVPSKSSNHLLLQVHSPFSNNTNTNTSTNQNSNVKNVFDIPVSSLKPCYNAIALGVSNTGNLLLQLEETLVKKVEEAICKQVSNFKDLFTKKQEMEDEIQQQIKLNEQQQQKQEQQQSGENNDSGNKKNINNKKPQPKSKSKQQQQQIKKTTVGFRDMLQLGQMVLVECSDTYPNDTTTGSNFSLRQQGFVVVASEIENNNSSNNNNSNVANNAAAASSGGSSSDTLLFNTNNLSSNSNDNSNWQRGTVQYTTDTEVVINLIDVFFTPIISVVGDFKKIKIIDSPNNTSNTNVRKQQQGGGNKKPYQQQKQQQQQNTSNNNLTPQQQQTLESVKILLESPILVATPKLAYFSSDCWEKLIILNNPTTANTPSGYVNLTASAAASATTTGSQMLRELILLEACKPRELLVQPVYTVRRQNSSSSSSSGKQDQLISRYRSFLTEHFVLVAPVSLLSANINNNDSSNNKNDFDASVAVQLQNRLVQSGHFTYDLSAVEVAPKFLANLWK